MTVSSVNELGPKLRHEVRTVMTTSAAVATSLSISSACINMQFQHRKTSCIYVKSIKYV